MKITIHLFHLGGETIAAIERNNRNKRYRHVTPASQARLSMYVFVRAEHFRILPYVLGFVGWMAQGKGEVPFDPQKREG